MSKSVANDKRRMGPARTSRCMRTAPWAGVSHVERGIEQHTQHEVAAAASFYKGVVEKIIAAPEAKHDCAVGLRHESREKTLREQLPQAEARAHACCTDRDEAKDVERSSQCNSHTVVAAASQRRGPATALSSLFCARFEQLFAHDFDGKAHAVNPCPSEPAPPVQ